MPSLKDLRVRIASVKSTQRITAAMKMVAAAKLRRAQEQAEAARPYAERMERMLGSLAASAANGSSVPRLLGGTGRDDTHLIVLISSDRGLCGAFNTNLVRYTRQRIKALTDDGRTVKLLCVGRKGFGQLKRDHGDKVIDTIEDVSKPTPVFSRAAEIARRLGDMYDEDDFDICTVIYNKFVSALAQRVTPQQLVPFAPAAEEAGDGEGATATGGAIYEFEPSQEEILAELVPRNLAVQIYRALLESFASEQGARMTAMDSATRNAGEMIDMLTLNYNRTRQAFITKELIEIISGAEAL
ncbi:MAG: F0F1 ATP synthase subunit gamma [Alphaproteobacteria bacterium]